MDTLCEQRVTLEPPLVLGLFPGLKPFCSFILAAPPHHTTACSSRPIYDVCRSVCGTCAALHYVGLCVPLAAHTYSVCVGLQITRKEKRLILKKDRQNMHSYYYSVSIRHAWSHVYPSPTSPS